MTWLPITQKWDTLDYGTRRAGLAIARQMPLAMDGELTLRSRVGGGLAAFLTMPALPAG